MKKAAILYLLSIYAVATFGIGINSYYCCGKLTSVTISLVGQKELKCSEHAAPSCCKTKHQFLQVHDSHLASSVTVASAAPFPHELAPVSVAAIWLMPTRAGADEHFIHPPPRPSDCPLYILHDNYRL